ncbi:MAG: AzlD domain-containing protein [Spirochaetes bacterium]|nr:AzlD domain-containing protein [Spirochaetota bacterium]
MQNNIYLLILLMMLGTYIPRLLPFYMINAEKIPSWIRTYLSFVPYSILGALIFPGILNALPGSPAGSAITGAVCFISAFLFKGTFIPLFTGIGTAFIIRFFNLI